MIECPNCGKSISEFATECPHCKLSLKEPISTESLATASRKRYTKADLPLYALIAIAVVLGVFSLIIPLLLTGVEQITHFMFYGNDAALAYMVGYRCCKTVLAGILQIILVSVGMVVYHAKKDKIRRVELPITVLGIIDAVAIILLMTLTALSPIELNVSPVSLGAATDIANRMPIYFGVLFSSFTICGTYAFLKWGIKKGIICTAILAVVEFVVLFLRLPLIVSLHGGIAMMFWWVFAAAVAALQIIVLLVMGLIKGK